MEDKQTNYIDTNLLEQAGIGTIELSETPKKKKPWVLILGTGVLLLLLVGGVTAGLLISSKKPTSSLLPKNSTNKDAADIIRLIKSGNYSELKEFYVSDQSPLQQSQQDSSMVSAYVGDDIDWNNCTLPSVAAEANAQELGVDGTMYDVAYVPVNCDTTNKSKKYVEFDLRRVKDATGQWYLYFLVLKGSGDAQNK